MTCYDIFDCVLTSGPSIDCFCSLMKPHPLTFCSMDVLHHRTGLAQQTYLTRFAEAAKCFRLQQEIARAMATTEAQLGYPALKDKQADILVELIMHRNDVFGVLPTGYGKSLCFACWRIGGEVGHTAAWAVSGRQPGGPLALLPFVVGHCSRAHELRASSADSAKMTNSYSKHTPTFQSQHYTHLRPQRGTTDLLQPRAE